MQWAQLRLTTCYSSGDRVLEAIDVPVWFITIFENSILEQMVEEMKIFATRAFL